MRKSFVLVVTFITGLSTHCLAVGTSITGVVAPKSRPAPEPRALSDLPAECQAAVGTFRNLERMVESYMKTDAEATTSDHLKECKGQFLEDFQSIAKKCAQPDRLLSYFINRVSDHFKSDDVVGDYNRVGQISGQDRAFNILNACMKLPAEMCAAAVDQLAMRNHLELSTDLKPGPLAYETSWADQQNYYPPVADKHNLVSHVQDSQPRIYVCDATQHSALQVAYSAALKSNSLAASSKEGLAKTQTHMQYDKTVKATPESETQDDASQAKLFETSYSTTPSKSATKPTENQNTK